MRGLTLARNTRWLLFYLVILLAWLVLFGMAFTSQELAFTRIYGADFWAEICAVDATGARYSGVFLMWLLMSAAMMLPTFVPSLQVFDDLTHTKAANGGQFLYLVGGYLMIWVGFSAVAAMMQVGFSRLGWMAGSASVSTPLNVVLLICAGGYQFSTFKNACLSKCRQPLTFFMANWGQGPMRMGIGLGLVCVGCCWALMLLAFVGGTMNLLWMGAATVLMMLEKLPQIGRYLTRPLGVIMIILAVVVALN